MNDIATCNLRVLLAIVAALSIGCNHQQVQGIKSALGNVGHGYVTYSNTGSLSMVPTIGRNDVVVVDKSAYGRAVPARGDIIVFEAPIDVRDAVIRRVIALPGDRLEVTRGWFVINGSRMHRVWRDFHPLYTLAIHNYQVFVDTTPLNIGYADIPARSRWTTPNRLPSGCYFTIGDNVNIAEDSHVWGCTELTGTFSSGIRAGQAARLVGKVVKVIPLADRSADGTH